MLKPKFTFSIVSHNQANLVNKLLDDLNNIRESFFDVIVTSNTSENVPINQDHTFSFSLLNNDKPLGFGANHNKAFLNSDADFFIVTNPDIRIKTISLDSFLSHFFHGNSGIVGPAILNPLGKPEDSARDFPNLYSLFLKLICLQNPFELPKTLTSVDWIAGMFMIIPNDIFREVGGFDDKRFFMYYEDVDICLRVRNRGYNILYDPSQSVIHDAQRASRRSFRHMKWHLTSMFRFLSGI